MLLLLGFNSINTLGNVNQIEFVVFHRGFASLKTLSRIYQ